MTYFGLRGFNALVAIAMASLLMGCGGGGTSSGTGGAGGSLSSTLVIDLGGSGFAMVDPPIEGSGGALATISKLLVADVWAQILPDTKIFIDGNPATATIIEGIAYIPLLPGGYDVCINYAEPQPPDGSNCVMDVLVGEDQIVVITGSASEVTLDSVTVDDAADDIVDPQDPNHAHKILVCHKGRMTISVGKPAKTAHLMHDDSLGPCRSFAEGPTPDAQDGLTEETQTGKGKGKGKGKDKNKG